MNITDVRLETIILAIKNKKILQFTYKDEVREVEPYCLGRLATDKRDFALRAFQMGKGWRLFKIEEVTDLLVKFDSFSVINPQYNKSDKAMSEILAEI